MNAPSKGAVNGVYRNECCKDIVIEDDHLSYGDSSFGFDLENMKFGLTGYVDGKFTVAGIQQSEEPAVISFHNEGGVRVLSLPIDGRETDFRQVQ
jgi:hypothetical protein